MRVISQDGTKDFPYDSSSVSIYGGCVNGRIYVRMQLCGGYDDSVDVADYSTKAKALKAMKMLREAFFENKHEEAYREGIYYYSPCFQFPQDDEIEV